MMFFKKKVSLSSFIKIIADEVFKVTPYTYDNYLEVDKESILSHTEFREFNGSIPILRLLLLYAMLVDFKDKGQVKVSKDDLDKTFSQALMLSYQYNVVDQDEARRLYKVFSLELDQLSGYISGIPVKDLEDKGFTPYACMYFTDKFTNSSKESIKNGAYVSLINNQRLLMKDYFGKALDKVKIVIQG